MTLRVINADTFNDFTINYPRKHFLQSIGWADVSKHKGFNPIFLGLYKSDVLVAATLLLERKLLLGYKYHYAPRGFLLDYNDKELFDLFNLRLKEYLNNNKSIYLICDPDLKIDSPDNYYFDLFTKFGYTHTGYNLYFENHQPRFTLRLDITQDINDIFSNMHPNTRRILEKPPYYSINIFKGDDSNVRDFADLMSLTAKRDGFSSFGYDYYLNFYKELDKYGMSDIWIASVSLKQIIKETQELIQQSKAEQATFTSKKQKGLFNDYTVKIANLEKDLDEYKGYQDIYPDNIVLSSMITTKFGDKVWSIHGGNHDIMKRLNANYYLNFNILIDAKESGYELYDFFGTIGDKSSEKTVAGLDLFKRRFGGELYEFAGEFILVLRPLLYKAYLFVSKIRHR